MNTLPISKTPPSHPPANKPLAHTCFLPPLNSLILHDFRTPKKTTGWHPNSHQSLTCPRAPDIVQTRHLWHSNHTPPQLPHLHSSTQNNLNPTSRQCPHKPPPTPALDARH